MASRKKRTTTKSKRGKARATTRKKTVKRVGPKETEEQLSGNLSTASWRTIQDAERANKSLAQRLWSNKP